MAQLVVGAGVLPVMEIAHDQGQRSLAVVGLRRRGASVCVVIMDTASSQREGRMLGAGVKLLVFGVPVNHCYEP